MAQDDREDSCGCSVIHEDAVARARKGLEDDETLYYMAEFFRMFGDGTRLKIIAALLREELCVCDLACIISMSQSVVSHHLKILRQSRVITARRDGKVVYYTLSDEHIRGIFEQGSTHIREQ